MERSFKDWYAKEREAGKNLDSNDDEQDKPSQEVAMNTSKSMLFVRSDVTAIDQIEHLKEDKSVEDESEASHLIVIPNRGVIVVVVEVEDAFICTHDNHHDCDHGDGAPKDLSVHGSGHDIALTSLVVCDIGRWLS